MLEKAKLPISRIRVCFAKWQSVVSREFQSETRHYGITVEARSSEAVYHSSFTNSCPIVDMRTFLSPPCLFFHNNFGNIIFSICTVFCLPEDTSVHFRKRGRKFFNLGFKEYSPLVNQFGFTFFFFSSLFSFFFSFFFFFEKPDETSK